MYFLPNIVGTFALGLCTTSQTLLPKSWQPLAKGFNTGFCGSLTTFSTWHLMVGLEVLNGQWLDGLTESALVFATSYLALLAGIQVGSLLTSIFSVKQMDHPVPGSPALFFSRNSRVIHVTTPADENVEKPATEVNAESLVSSWWYWPVAVLSLVTSSTWLLFAFDTQRKNFWLAMAFGPFGALLRHLLSFGNQKTPNFPVFTLIANEVATAANILIIIIFNMIQPSASSSALATFQLWVRSGLSTGFMGSLSTVSTWINELHKLSSTKSLSLAYRYGLVTVVFAQIIVVGLGAAYEIIAQKHIDF
uniref:Uncharacterized protein n=1 Tax=Plectus sambesii TaxID=2011161 RepID=A0A914VEM0_9BILA